MEFIRRSKARRVTLQFPDELVGEASMVAQMLQSSLGSSLEDTKENSEFKENKDESEKSQVLSEKSEVLSEKSEDNQSKSACSADTCNGASAGASNCSNGASAGPSNCSNGPSKCGTGAGGTSATVWLLADTSYSPCCVDEVAAAHVSGDLVIHYGDACLNPVSNLPVAYVFGKPAIDKTQIISQFKATYQPHQKVVIMADTPHSYILKDLLTELGEYTNVVVGDVLNKSFPEATIIGPSPNSPSSPNSNSSSNSSSTSSPNSFHFLNRCFLGPGLGGDPAGDIGSSAGDIGSSAGEEDPEQALNLALSLLEYSLFHITSPPPPRLLKLTTIFSSVSLYIPSPTNPVVKSGPFPSLMKRYRAMQIARASGTIGLLVNTLSLANTKTLLNSLKTKISSAGKKHYMFVVGKPNVAKLANFELIDVWCVLGCDHQGIILDQTGEYFKSIVTPYELILSLGELEWSGKWETDFLELVQLADPGQHAGQGKEEDTEDPDQADQAPTFDPVTGKLTSATPLRRPQYLEIDTGDTGTNEASDETSLVKNFSSAVTIKDTVSTAAIQLQNRAWTGLGSDYVDQGEGDEALAGALVEEGTVGIARGYGYDVTHK